jgi:hypothetical protein
VVVRTSGRTVRLKTVDGSSQAASVCSKRIRKEQAIPVIVSLAPER